MAISKISYLAKVETTFLQSKSEIDNLDNIYLIGIPLEDTVSFRKGTKNAPQTIRQVSPYVEITSSRLRNIPIEIIRDLGDIELLYGDILRNLDRIKTSITDILNIGIRNIVIIGGEHTITYAIMNAVERNGILLILDAHLDSRNEWPYGQRISHATHLRRILEEKCNISVIHIGARSYDYEELNFLKNYDNILIIDSKTIKDENVNIIRLLIRDFLSTISKPYFRYVSLDFDVYDISYMPAVSNPEGYGGLEPRDVMNIVDIFCEYCSKGYVNICDFVEYCPNEDRQLTYATFVIKNIVDFIDLLYLSSTNPLS